MIEPVMSENSMGFLAPLEARRILGDAINLCWLGQHGLHRGLSPSHNPPIIENVAAAGKQRSVVSDILSSRASRRTYALGRRQRRCRRLHRSFGGKPAPQDDQLCYTECGSQTAV